MKTAVGLALATLATLSPVLAAPGRMDVSKRSSKVSTEEKAILPENKAIERNDVLMDKRVPLQPFEKKDALVGERRSGIAVEESRDKKLFRTPERKEYEHIERKDSRWSGMQSRYSTADDKYDSKVALRFQDKIDDAQPFVDSKPVISKRATFDRVNRFSFRRNNSDSVTVTTAGSETAPRDISGASSTNPDSKPQEKDAANSPEASEPARAARPVRSR